MSVINQVLNQLDQRGAHPAPEQTMVRAVPHGKRSFAIPLLALGLALAGGIAAWQWIQIRKPKVVAVSAVQLQPAVVAMPAPASAALTVTAASAAIAGEAPLAEMLSPASRLSFELSSIPLPSAEDRPVSAAPPARPAKPQPIQAASPNARAAVQLLDGISPMKQVSPAQQVDAEFRKAVALMQQGHIADAIAGYEAVLRLDVGYDAARQALVALLLEGKRGADAERVLQGGLKNKPEHTGFAMLLARLQVERGAVEPATATLEKTLPYADRQADYQAFFAALLQRQNRHKEAITHYQIALQLAPDNGIWLMGYGISLQAVQRTDDARDAFRRALDSKTLNLELQAFVQQKLKGL
ncbi:MAG: tetratricopeptide repeat protein [Gallionella sp.]|nr:tetratricopeptide repeat protein [Gallionella sp.]